jgi:hypothetical protein
MNIIVVYAPNAVGIFLVVGGKCEIMNFPNFQKSLGDIAVKFVSVNKIKSVQEAVKINKN